MPKSERYSTEQQRKIMGRIWKQVSQKLQNKPKLFLCDIEVFQGIPKRNVLKNIKDGSILVKEEDILEMWEINFYALLKDYCNEYEEENEKTVTENTQPEIQRIGRRNAQNKTTSGFKT